MLKLQLFHATSQKMFIFYTPQLVYTAYGTFVFWNTKEKISWYEETSQLRIEVLQTSALNCLEHV